MTEKGESDGGKSEQATEEWDTQIRGKRIKVGRGSGEVGRDVAWRNMKRVTSPRDGEGMTGDYQAIYVQVSSEGGGQGLMKDGIEYTN